MEGFDKKLSEGEMPTNLRLANKLLKNGFDVFMLTNPNDITSADFILRKNGKLYMAEGKESYGENSLDSTFKKIKEQASIGIVDILGTTDIRYIAGEIKYAFNHYKNLERCLIFKGSKLLQINRALTQHRKFEEQFMRLWRK